MTRPLPQLRPFLVTVGGRYAGKLHLSQVRLVNQRTMCGKAPIRLTTIRIVRKGEVDLSRVTCQRCLHLWAEHFDPPAPPLRIHTGLSLRGGWR